MEEKMIHRLFIPLAHTMPINYNDMPLPKIVHSKDLLQSCRLKKKVLPQRQILFQEKRDIVTRKDTVEGANSK
jgi:hypothetical protein